MASSVDQAGPGTGGPGRCPECGTALAADQRYCLQCGARNGPLPAAVAGALPGMLARKKGNEGPPPAAPEPKEPKSEPEDGADPDSGKEEDGGGLFPPGYMPSPRTAALAVLGMLGLGVLLGSATSQLAQSAGLGTILLEASPSHQEEASEPAEEEFEEAFAETEVTETPEAIPSSVPAEEVPEAGTPGSEEPAPEAPPEEFVEPSLPPVKHVFVIVLGENGFEETFGTTSQAPYLSQTLPEQGELLPNYFAVTKGELANQIALVSGQGPTVETAANCPVYADLSPGTVSKTGQVEGGGCVYPAETPTLMSRLEEHKLTWKAYVEDIGAGAPAGLPATCRHPTLGASDPGPSLESGDFYETWRNPFVYFHSVTDKPACAERDVGLDQLAADLKSPKTTPTLSYVVPSVCNDGGAEPCAVGAPAGPVSAEDFLKTVVPEIQASAAYEKEGGLIAITSAEAPQNVERPDRGACCTTPEYPNLPPEPPPQSTGPVKETGGGGKVGMLLLSPFVKPGTVDESSYFNHYSLLLSIVELFGLERLGYTTDPSAVGFDPTIYNNAPASVSSVKRQSKRIRTAVSRPRATAPTVSVRSGHADG